MQEFIIPAIAILIMSVVIHEVSHGYVAEILGDPTARLAGRLTLNPIKHLDPFGSVIIPALLVLSGSSFLIGWAKPVPYNPYNLQKGKYGPGIVALAGPLSNFAIAIFFALLIRIGIFTSIGSLTLASYAVLINIALGFLNLIPVPPLDGSKVLSSFLPYKQYMKWQQIEGMLGNYSLIFAFIFIFLFIGVFSDFVDFVFRLLVGYSF